MFLLGRNPWLLLALALLCAAGPAAGGPALVKRGEASHELMIPETAPCVNTHGLVCDLFEPWAADLTQKPSLGKEQTRLMRAMQYNLAALMNGQGFEGWKDWSGEAESDILHANKQRLIAKLETVMKNHLEKRWAANQKGQSFLPKDPEEFAPKPGDEQLSTFTLGELLKKRVAADIAKKKRASPGAPAADE